MSNWRIRQPVRLDSAIAALFFGLIQRLVRPRQGVQELLVWADLAHPQHWRLPAGDPRAKSSSHSPFYGFFRLGRKRCPDGYRGTAEEIPHRPSGTEYPPTGCAERLIS